MSMALQHARRAAAPRVAAPRAAGDASIQRAVRMAWTGTSRAHAAAATTVTTAQRALLPLPSRRFLSTSAHADTQTAEQAQVADDIFVDASIPAPGVEDASPLPPAAAAAAPVVWTLPALHANISVYQKSGNTGAAEAVWARMQRLGMRPTTDSYRRLMLVHVARGGGYESAARVQALHEQMQSEGLRFGAPDLDALVALAAQCGNIDAVQVWVGRVRDAGLWAQLREETRVQVEAMAEREDIAASSASDAHAFKASGGGGAFASSSTLDPSEALPGLWALVRGSRVPDVLSKALMQAEVAWAHGLASGVVNPADTLIMVRICIKAAKTKRALEVVLEAVRLEERSQSSGRMAPLAAYTVVLEGMARRQHAKTLNPLTDAVFRQMVRLCEEGVLDPSSNEVQRNVERYLIFLRQRPALVFEAMRSLPRSLKHANEGAFRAAWELVPEANQSPSIRPRLLAMVEALVVDMGPCAIPWRAGYIHSWISVCAYSGAATWRQAEQAWQFMRLVKVQPTADVYAQMIIVYLSTGAQTEQLAKAESLYAETLLPANQPRLAFTLTEFKAVAECAGSLGLTQVESTWIDRARAAGHFLHTTTLDKQKAADNAAAAAAEAPASASAVPAPAEGEEGQVAQANAEEGEEQMDVNEEEQTDAADQPAGGAAPPPPPPPPSSSVSSFLHMYKTTVGPVPELQAGKRLPPPVRPGTEHMSEAERYKHALLHDRAGITANVGDLPAPTTLQLSHNKLSREQRRSNQNAERNRLRLRNLQLQPTPEQMIERELELERSAMAAAEGDPAAAAATAAAAADAPSTPYLSTEMSVVYADLSKLLAQLAEIRTEGSHLFRLTEMRAGRQERMAKKPVYRALMKRAATALAEVTKLITVRAGSSHPVFPSQGQWIQLFQACDQFQMDSRALPLYQLMLRLAVIKADVSKLAQMDADGGSPDAAATERRSKKKAKGKKPTATLLEPLNITPAVGGPASMSTESSGAADTLAPAFGAATGSDTPAAEIPANESKKARLRREWAEKKRRLAELEARDPNPLPSVELLAADEPGAAIPDPFIQYSVLRCVAKATPGLRGAEHAYKLVEYMLRAGYIVNPHAAGAVLDAFVALLPIRARTDPTPIQHAELAQVRQRYERLAAAVPVPEEGPDVLAVAMLRAYLVQRDFAASETLLAQLRAQRPMLDRSLIRAQLQSISIRRMDLTFEQAEISRLYMGADTAQAMAASLTVPAQHLQNDADELWQLALSDPKRLLSTGAVIQMMLMASASGDIPRQLAILDQALQLEEQMRPEAPTMEDPETGMPMADPTAPRKFAPLFVDGTPFNVLFKSFARDSHPHRWIGIAHEAQLLMQRRYQEALKSSDKSRAAALQPNDSNVAAYINFLEASLQFRHIEEALRTMPRHLLEANPVAYLGALTAAAASGSTKTADAIVSQFGAHAIQWDLRIASARIAATELSGDWREAESLWQTMLHQGIAPDASVYRHLIQTYMVASKKDSSLNAKIDAAVDEMRSGKGPAGVMLRFTVQDYHQLLLTCQTWRLVSMARRWSEQAQRDGLWPLLNPSTRQIVTDIPRWGHLPVRPLSQTEVRLMRVSRDLKAWGVQVPPTNEEMAAMEAEKEKRLLAEQAAEQKRLDTMAKKLSSRQRAKLGRELTPEELEANEMRARERLRLLGLEAARAARAKKAKFTLSRHAVKAAHVPRAAPRVVVRRMAAPISKMARAVDPADAGAEFSVTSVSSEEQQLVKRGRRALGMGRKTPRASAALRAGGKLKRKVKVLPPLELRDLLPAIVRSPASVVKSWYQGGLNYLDWTASRIRATVRDIAPREVDVAGQVKKIRQEQMEEARAQAAARVVHLQPATQSRPTLAQRTPSAVPNNKPAGPHRKATHTNAHGTSRSKKKQAK